MQTTIERYVEQVEEAKQYKGYIIIGGTKLYFAIIIGEAILDQLIKAEDIKKLRGIIKLAVSRAKTNGARIRLTDNEFYFFAILIIDLLEDFEKDNQIGKDSLTEMGLPQTISFKGAREYKFHPQACRLLKRDKFGCRLVA